MEHSEQLDALGAALAKAQAAVKGAKKDSANPFFKSSYADLASVWEACREALTANGLSVVQLPGFENGIATLDTILLHSSGQWISGKAGAPLGKQDAQGVGSVITYLRRYALAAVASVSPEDDDGEAAVQRKAPKAQQPSPVPPPQALSEKPAALTKSEPMPWEEPVWPAGAKKGKPLKDLDSADLVSGLAWIRKTGRYGELVEPIETLLASREGE